MSIIITIIKLVLISVTISISLYFPLRSKVMYLIIKEVASPFYRPSCGHLLLSITDCICMRSNMPTTGSNQRFLFNDVCTVPSNTMSFISKVAVLKRLLIVSQCDYNSFKQSIISLCCQKCFFFLRIMKNSQSCYFLTLYIEIYCNLG